jgi:hypothetical protein
VRTGICFRSGPYRCSASPVAQKLKGCTDASVLERSIQDMLPHGNPLKCLCFERPSSGVARPAASNNSRKRGFDWRRIVALKPRHWHTEFSFH